MKWTLFLVAMAVSYAQSANKCADLTRFRIPGTKIEITRAELVPAGLAPGGRGGPAGPALPAHCRVNGALDQRTGPDGKPMASGLPSRFQRTGLVNTCSRAEED